MKPRLIATDLDGTLVRSDGRVSPRSVAAISGLDAVGVGFMMVTARPPRWLHDLRHLVGDHGVVICSNGAFVYDVPSQRITAEHGIDAATVCALAADLRTALPGIAFAVETRDGFGHEPGYVGDHPVPDGSPVAEVEELLALPTAKLLARCDSVAPSEFHRRVAAVVGDRAVPAYSGASGLAEISAAGVTKAAALASWCTDLGIDQGEVWAFGDMPNDLPMLAWAGRSYAVANAHPDVLAMADRRCGSNDDDGVAEVLEQLRR